MPCLHNPTDQDLLQTFPKGSKVVHRQVQKGGLRVDGDGDQSTEVKVHESCTNQQEAHEILTVGIPREAQDFLRRAVKAGHPRSISIHLSDVVKDVLAENSSCDEHKIVKTCASFLWKWSARAKELQADEQVLHAKMPEHFQYLLKGKRLLLLKEVLESLEYPDTNLVAEISNGFTLHGWMAKSRRRRKDQNRLWTRSRAWQRAPPR